MLESLSVLALMLFSADLCDLLVPDAMVFSVDGVELGTLQPEQTGGFLVSDPAGDPWQEGGRMAPFDREVSSCPRVPTRWPSETFRHRRMNFSLEAWPYQICFHMLWAITLSTVFHQFGSRRWRYP